MKNYKHLLTSVFFVIFLAAFAQTTLSKDVWTRVNSKNFHLIGNANEKEIRKVATKLEQFRETFRLIYNTANFDSAIPTNVVVFKSSSAYKPFKPKRADGKIDEWIGGYFQPGKDVNYITLSTEGGDAEVYGTIFHEYVHFMVNLNFGKSDVPPWFNEGLAEYYQTFVIEEDQKVKLGLPQNGHLRLLQDNKLIPLDTLFNVSNYALHQNANHSRSVFYAQSWALIHYLIQGRQTSEKDALNKFLNGLFDKQSPEKAFQNAFKIEYAEMEKELKKYVSQGTYKYQLLNFKQKLTFDAELKTSQLSEAETNAYLGDLLFHIRREDDAEPFLQKTLALDPNSSMANTTLGMIKLRQRKFDDAKKYLEKAISTDSKNDQAYYNYAYLLSREGRDEFGFSSGFSTATVTKMRDALRKAIAINPKFTPSYELFAFINLVRNEQLDESIQMLKKALTFQPGDQEIILRIAEIMFRQEKVEDAKILAEKISKTSSEPDSKSRADDLLSNIRTFQEIKARNEQLRREYEAKSNSTGGESRKGGEEIGGDSGPRLKRRKNAGGSTETPEATSKSARDERIQSINQVLAKPKAGEKQIIGRITKISCPPKMVVYSVKTETGIVTTLFSKDFQSLTLVAFDSDAKDAQVGCNNSFTKYNSVLTYKPSNTPKSPHSGELTAIDFVPDDFRFLTAEESESISKSNQAENSGISNEQSESIISGSPEEIEDQRKRAMMNAIKQAMRQPQTGEVRLTGKIEKIDCEKDGMFFYMKNDTQILKLKSTTGIQIKSFTNDLEQIEFGCGLKQFDALAVFTYKPSSEKKTKSNGDLISIEFVPRSFKLEP